MAKSKIIDVKGMDELIKAFIAAGTDAPRFALTALKEETDEVFFASQYVIPVRYGALKSSGVVHDPVMVRPNLVETNITYGSSAVNYAIYVHELPPGRAKHDPPTRWKYLEYPAKMAAERMGKNMAVRVLDMVNRRFDI